MARNHGSRFGRGEREGHGLASLGVGELPAVSQDLTRVNASFTTTSAKKAHFGCDKRFRGVEIHFDPSVRATR
jgi:hypothetical protein